MIRLLVILIALAVSVTVAHADPVNKRPTPETFLVYHYQSGLVFLSADGRDQERLVPQTTSGALSPDGRWIASIQRDEKSARMKWIIRPRRGPGEPVTVPLTWDVPGSFGCQLNWASDSDRILISENGSRMGEAPQYSFRVHELATKKVTELKLPEGSWVTGWSLDGKRLLARFRGADRTLRIGWINFDGTGTPEFLTPEDELAYSARLSPDGRRILFKAGPKPPNNNELAKMRLYVMDLTTKKRTAVDEPGQTEGHCWSPDGSRVAYTWQRSLDKPEEVPLRETFLFTCDLEGKNRKTITSRTCEVPKNSSGRSGISYFFCVVEWR